MVAAGYQGVVNLLSGISWWLLFNCWSPKPSAMSFFLSSIILSSFRTGAYLIRPRLLVLVIVITALGRDNIYRPRERGTCFISCNLRGLVGSTGWTRVQPWCPVLSISEDERESLSWSWTKIGLPLGISTRSQLFILTAASNEPKTG